MARKTREELNDIKQRLGVDTLWSWSRYNLWHSDKWEYYLKYVLHKREDRSNSIYAASGSLAHDILEKYYSDEIKQSDMFDLYEDGLFNLNIADMKYDRNDKEKNDNIANKYENCIRHFFKHHQKPDMKMTLEKFFTMQVTPSIVFQGYIDNSGAIIKDKMKHVIVTDYKTSTIYKGEKLESESGQLLTYAEALHQLTKLPYEQIQIRYLFMKYVTVNCLQANDKWKERYIERNSIGESLVSSVKMWLKKCGYEDKIDEYIEEMVLVNSIDMLPEEVKKKFVISDCYVTVPYDREKIEGLKQNIVATVNEIEDTVKQYEETKDENLFWQDVTDKDSYRLNVLSGYSSRLHKPYAEYLEQRETKKEQNENSNKDDLLAWINEL